MEARFDPGWYAPLLLRALPSHPPAKKQGANRIVLHDLQQFEGLLPLRTLLAGTDRGVVTDHVRDHPHLGTPRARGSQRGWSGLLVVSVSWVARRRGR